MKKRAPNQFRPFLAIAFFALRAMTRNRATMFFGFVFPLMFIAVFGLFGNNGFNISIGIPENSQSSPIYEALANVQAIKIVSGTTEELKDKLSQGRIAAVLETPKAEPPKLLISQANPSQAAAATSMVGGVVDKMNLHLSGVNVNSLPIKLEVEEISGRVFRFIDFFLPGMIGFALLTTAITSTGFGLIFLKKTLVLKRIFATPTKGITILFGQGTARLIMVLMQTLVIIGVGIFAFKFNLIHGFWTLAQILLLSVIGLVSFLGFGLFVAGVSNDENTVAPLANLFVLPQFLVAGTFFPIDSLPSWIQPVVNVLPLAFFNTAIRKITVEGLAINHLLPQLAGLVIWAALAYLLASRTFRWE